MIARRVLLAAIVVLIVAAFSLRYWLLNTESGARFAWGHAETALDGLVTAELIGGDVSSGLEFRDLKVTTDSVAVSIRDLALAANVSLLPFSVELDAVRLVSVDVAVTSAEESGADDAVNIPAVLESLALPFRLTIRALEAEAISIDVGEQAFPEIEQLLLSGAWHEDIGADIRLTAADLELRGETELSLNAPFDIELAAQLDAQAGDDAGEAEVEINGTVDEFAISLEATIAVSGHAPLAVSLDGLGSPASLVVDTVAATSDDVEVTGSGQLGWGETMIASGEFDVARLALTRILDDWPADRPIRGRTAFELAPGQLELRDTELAIVGTGSRVSGGGSVDLDANAIRGDLEWRSLQWPPVGDDPLVSSSEGKIRLAGDVDAWQVDGDFELDSRDLPGGRFDVDGRGDRERAEVVLREGRVFGGSVAGTADFSWVGERAWNASLDFADIRTESLAPQFDGVLSGHVDAAGAAAPIRVRATLRDIGGELVGYGFEAEGSIDYAPGVLRADGLRIEHGDNRLLLDGDPATAAGIVFTARVDDLGDYLPDATGGVDAEGSFGIRDGLPWLNLAADAELVQVGDVQIDGFEVSDLAPRDDSLTHLKISAQEVTLFGQRVLSPSVEATVAETEQTLAVDVGYEGVRLLAAVRGTLDSFSEPAQWQGQLEQLLFVFSGHPPVSLPSPADISLAPERIAIERLCLSEAGGAKLCGEFAWHDDQRIDVSAELSDMPVAMVNALGPTGFDFGQRASGHLEWHTAVGVRPTGSASIEIGPGFITSEDRPDMRFETATSTIAFDVRDGRLLAGKLQIPMPATGVVDGAFSVLDLADPVNSEIEGSINIFMHDIGAVAALTPLIDAASGRLSGRTEISGTVLEPYLNGDITLEDASLDYEPIGLVLTDVQMVARLRGERALEVEGTFRNGDGVGRVYKKTGLEGSAAEGLRLTVEGERLSLIDVDDVRAIADVNIDLGYVNNELSIDGDIAIPTARITPSTLPASRATVSDDVVIVAGELPMREEVERTESPLSVYGRLDVALGPDVTVEVGPATASIQGLTRFSWSGDPMPLADGRYDLEGSIEAFGQLLRITEGGIRFPNVPANDPYVRVRAEREIFGNSQVKAAGVLVDGRLTRPTIEAYTNPLTTEERALTLLVTGSDFDLEQGVGAVDFGTYIAPRLFVSYGIGIFDRDNIISARYDLKRGFGVRATSGQRESGLDVIYRLER